MATINHSSGADIIVPSNNGTTYRGLAGDDTYIISNGISANASITIVDTSGANKIQLVDGLSIASSKFAADAVQLTLSNGAVVTINGASNFTYDVGGNATTGTSGSSNSLAELASAMGVASLPSSGSTAGSSDVSISGSSVSGGSATYTYTVSKDASAIDEGEAVTFTVTSNSAVTSDTTLTWTVIGSDNGKTVDKATGSDIDAQSGTVTIAAGSSSATFSVAAINDSVAEGIEGMQVSVFSPDSATISTSTILVNNTGASASAQTFNGTSGVDNNLGASGNDTFDYSTSGELNDVDTLDGGAGSDILSVTNAGATLTPNVENIETLNATPTGALIINLANTESQFSSIKSVSDGGNNLTVNDLAVLPGKVGITNGTGNLTVNMKAAAVAGTSDTINIELAGAATGADVTITSDAVGTSSIEAATINSISAANTLTTLALDGAASLTVTGDQSLTLTQALASSVTTIDASGMAGALGLTLSADPAATAATAITITGSPGIDSLRGTAAGADTINAGGGNDTITFATSGQLTAKDVVDGGAGTDTVSTENAATVASVLGGLSNVEKLAITGSGATLTLASDVNPTTFVIGDTDNQTVTLNDDYSNATTVQTIGDTGSADTITNNSGVALTVLAYTTDLSAARGSTLINMAGDLAAATTTIVLDSTTGILAGTDILIGSEIITVASITNGTTLEGVRGSKNTTAAAHSDNDAVTFSQDSSLTITGNAAATDTLVLYATGEGNLDVNGSATATSIDAITVNSTLALTGAYSAATSIDVGLFNTPLTVTNNLGALDGALTMDFSAGAASGTLAGTVHYTGGAGVDVVYLGTANDTIDSGAGNDIITSGTGVNTITTGAGVDTVYMGTGVDIIDAGAANDIIVAGASDLLANDVVDGGDGTDQLQFAATGYTDESVFGGLTSVESIKGSAGNGINQALPFNSNTSFSIIDASGAGDTLLTLSVGYTQDTTVKLGSTDLVNADEIVNGTAVTGANVNLTVTATDQGSFDTATIITGGTGTDTITLTNVTDTNVAANDHMVLTNATSIDVLNIVDYTNGIDTTVTAGTNGAVRTPMTVNATTLDAGETLDFDGNASTSPLTINSGAGADSLDGGTVDDVIYGNAGIDTIDGQENSAVYGADAIYGGAGNDIINVSTAETEFSNSSTTALVTDTVDGGAGTDSLVFAIAATLTRAELVNISNIEKMTLADTSTITLSDAFLQANPGIAITLAAGTINAGSGTAASPTITEAVTYTLGSGNIKITTGTADDTFNTASTVFDGDDTINGGAGTDTIAIYNDAQYGVGAKAGDAASVTLDINHTNIEKITVVDLAIDDTADVTVTINTAWTGTSLTIDASSLDQNALSTAQEILTVSQNSADLAALTVTGGEGNDIISTGAVADNVTGNGGIDTITTNAGNDTISAGAGNDIINAGAGRDHIDAGTGNDTITVTADAHFEVSGGTETVDGGAGVDILSFTEAGARDISAAEMGSVSNIEVIDIGSGTGNSATVIGLGDTFFSNNNSAVTINANSSTAGTSATTKVDAGAVSVGAVTLVLKGDLTGVNDTLVGGAGDDTLQIGYKGLSAAADQELEATDVFTGNGGTDTIVFDTQADGTNGGEGAIAATIDFDNITGVEKILVKDADGSGAAADTIVVTLSTNVTAANTPATFEFDGSVKTDTDDTINWNYNNATTGDNTALTTKFTLKGGWGVDSLYGAAGADTITGNVGNDILSGFGQSDTIDGGSGDDTIKGGDETALTGVGDSLTGGSGADIIDGGAGADTISGGDGADVITGGTGADSMTGGSGADTFIYAVAGNSGGSNIDTITDFNEALGDVIKVTISAAQIEAWYGDTAATSTTFNFSAADLGDQANLAEAGAILTGNIGEAVFITDLNQLAIDYDGNGVINSTDLRINLTGKTAYDDASVAYILATDADTARTYTMGDAADSVTGGGAADTITGNGGNDTLAGGTSTDIISGGAGNDSITAGAGVDVITGGAGNDIIIMTAGEADVWTAAGVTAAAPYAGTNNGSDVVTFIGGAAETDFNLDALASLAGAGGTDDWLTTTAGVGAVLTDIVSATGNVALDNKVIALDDGDTTPTAAELASKIKTTTNTDNEYLSLADNGAGVIVHGDAGGATMTVTIWWVDSLIDGDGTDVTAADVHLLITSAASVDLDTLHGAQFID